MFHQSFPEFDLLVGESALEIFDWFNLVQFHGLDRRIIERKIKGESKGLGIHGWANYHPEDTLLNRPKDKKPYLFLNEQAFQGNFRDCLLVNHEAMHLALLLFNYDIKNYEEEIITRAEFISEQIIELLFETSESL